MIKIKDGESLRNVLKKPSIFYSILGTLLLLAILITILVTVFLGRILIENKSRQTDQTSILRLEQAAETLETAFSSIEAAMNQLRWNSEFISFSVDPDGMELSQDLSILQVLNNLEFNDLVDVVYLASKYSEQVYTSQGEILSLTETEELSSMWDAWISLDLSDEEDISSDMRNGMFRDAEGSLYIYAELVWAKRISVLICRVDREAMSQMLRANSDQPASYISVFDEEGEALLEDYYPYCCGAEDLSDSSLFQISAAVSRKGNIYYLYVSDSNQWSYVVQKSSAISSVTVGEMAAVLLPILVLMVFVSFLFAWYIAQSVYRPIGKLVELFMGGRDAHNPEPPSDAFAYMENAYKRMAGENEKMRGMAKEFSMEILKDTMKKILDGRILSEEYLEETLANIGYPVQIHDRYMVLVGHLEPPESGPSQTMEENMYIISIHEIVSAWESPDVQVIVIYTYFDTFAVVLTAASHIAAVSLKREGMKIREKVTQISREFPYRFYWGMGRMYEHISDLKYSYADARRDLQRQMYQEGTWEPEPETDETLLYIEMRMAQVTAELSEANREESEALIQRMIEEIRQKSNSNAQAGELFEQLCSSLLEKMLSMHIPEDEIKNIFNRPIHRIFSETVTVDGMAQAAQELCQQSLWMIEMYSRKSKYMYVEEAEKYVRQHYKDSDLSQNNVAEHIGITPAYLSERFREVTGESFVTYLNRYRVEQAKLLLATSSVSVGEIGFLCGFNSAQNFSRVFRKFTGMTPSQYRMKNQQN